MRSIVRPTGWGRTFTSLQEPEFAWYFAGNMAFFMAMQMQNLLRGFLAFELTDSATALGLITATIAVPLLIASPFGGVTADRVNKRTLLLITQSAAAVASLIVALLILTDQIVFWHLLVASLGTGLIFSFNMPARQALVPQLVPQHKMMNAISLQMGGQNVSRILAPAVAGLLIAPFGVGYVYLLTTVLFVLAVLSELRLPKHGMQAMDEDERRPFMDDLRGGFAYVLSQPTLRMLMLLALLFPLFAFPVQQMLPVFAEDVFDVGSGGLGILAAVTGVGGLVGAILAANMDRQEHKGRLMLVGALAMGSLILAFTQMNTFFVALLFLGLANIGAMIFMTTNNSVIQASLPPEMRGRVMSVLMMSFGLMPLGVLPVTIAADAIGAQGAVAIAQIALLVTVAVIFTRSRRLRNLRIKPLAYSDLSPVQAAALVAEGKMTKAEAERLTHAESGRVILDVDDDEDDEKNEDDGPSGPAPASNSEAGDLETGDLARGSASDSEAAEEPASTTAPHLTSSGD